MCVGMSHLCPKTSSTERSLAHGMLCRPHPAASSEQPQETGISSALWITRSLDLPSVCLTVHGSRASSLPLLSCRVNVCPGRGPVSLKNTEKVMVPP